MSMSPPGGRRSLDGPIRRVPTVRAVRPPAPVSVPDPAPVVQSSRTSSGDDPVFEYRKPKRLRGGLWRYGRFAAIGVLVIGVLGGGWIAYKALTVAHKVIVHAGKGAPALAGALDLTKLKGEGDGRINMLILGIGGAGHDGPNLSDSIMVWSIDPKTKDVAMLSVPRDLYVKIPGHGYGKINAANASGGTDEAVKVVSGILGVPIHYYTVIDFSGFRQAIDAVGGIDINVDKPLYDPEFPCDNDKGYCPLTVKPGLQHMSGTIALRYARCRHGICGGDFGRAARQQQVLVALRQKAMQASTLTNPVKLAGLIDAVGSHVKTDMQLSEMQKLALIAKDVDPTKIVNKVLDIGKPDSLLEDGSGKIAGAGSIELPKAGTFVYADIQDFVKNIFVDHYITDEAAKLEVQNGSGTTGLAGTVAASLKAAHYAVSDAVNAPELHDETVLYDYTNGKKPYTINYLEHRFGVKAQRMTAPAPSTDASGATVATPEIRIILGSNYGQGSSGN